MATVKSGIKFDFRKLVEDTVKSGEVENLEAENKAGKIRGLLLAEILLERSLGEGYNCSLFSLYAFRNLEDDGARDECYCVEDAFFRFVEKLVVPDDPKEGGIFDNPLAIACGFVYGLLPEEYR